MKKFTLLCVIAILFASFLCMGMAMGDSSSDRSQYYYPEFTLRNGLTWGMSKEMCLQKLDDEGIQYMSAEEAGYDFSSALPYEEGRDEAWFYIGSVSFGSDNEEVTLYLSGTRKTGLYEITYVVIPYKDVDNRVNELLVSLENKYGKLKIQKNDGKYRYSAWKNFDYAAIMLYIMKDTPDMIWLTYNSPKRDEIITSLQDGSYYITTPYGL